MGAHFAARRMPEPGAAVLEAQAVDAWLAWLDPDHETAPCETAVLSADERRRAGGMATAVRRRFVRARALLRGLLASYLSADPASIEFGYGPKGKPRLAGSAARSGLHFSLSHCGGQGLLAFGRAPLGADIETVRPLRDMAALAARFFAPAERLALGGLPADERQRAFFACWTRKEAYAKAVGTGIGMPLGSFAVTVAPGAPPALLGADGSPDPDWSLHDVSPRADVAAALAIECPGALPRCWRLDTGTVGRAANSSTTARTDLPCPP